MLRAVVEIRTRDEISFTKVSQLFVNLKNKYTNGLEDDYIPLSIRNEFKTCLRRLRRSSKIAYSTKKGYVDQDVLKRWEEMKSSTEQRWLEYLLCLPWTNASTERVFTLMNTMWTSEKSSLKVETLRAMLIVKFNMDS
ncbi:hypothetical protein PR048_025353, partial [Dryococelus australis]